MDSTPVDVHPLHPITQTFEFVVLPPPRATQGRILSPPLIARVLFPDTGLEHYSKQEMVTAMATCISRDNQMVDPKGEPVPLKGTVLCQGRKLEDYPHVQQVLEQYDVNGYHWVYFAFPGMTLELWGRWRIRLIIQIWNVAQLSQRQGPVELGGFETHEFEVVTEDTPIVAPTPEQARYMNQLRTLGGPGFGNIPSA
ncbi:hypothetical protein QBC39DRAFT_328853 [Podospora conica]|nr:hypothetical protein QBC39DRAFT_328853 [Schizothecium conicum]